MVIQNGYAYPPRWIQIPEKGRFALVCSGVCYDVMYERWFKEGNKH